jgi:hypothetical protein
MSRRRVCERWGGSEQRAWEWECVREGGRGNHRKCAREALCRDSDTAAKGAADPRRHAHAQQPHAVATHAPAGRARKAAGGPRRRRRARLREGCAAGFAPRHRTTHGGASVACVRQLPDPWVWRAAGGRTRARSGRVAARRGEARRRGSALCERARRIRARACCAPRGEGDRRVEAVRVLQLAHRGRHDGLPRARTRRTQNCSSGIARVFCVSSCDPKLRGAASRLLAARQLLGALL